MRPLITTVDQHRIASCLQWLPNAFKRAPGHGLLLQRIRAAVAVDPECIPPSCVTMNSRVRLHYRFTNEVCDLRLVYPEGLVAFDDGFDLVSVISPVGAALLGSRVGDVIEWKAPTGIHQGEVLALLYQPEASGDPD